MVLINENAAKPDRNRSEAGFSARRNTRTGRRVRSGRDKGGDVAQAPVPLRRNIPPYEMLDEEGLCRLEGQADWILKEIGVEFRGDEVALSLFQAAGASVDGCRVRFDPGHARRLCATAPARFRMLGRDPRHTIEIGGDHVVLTPAYGAPFVTDLDRGRRYATLADFEAFVKLAQASPWLQHSGGTVCEPVDIPVNKRHLDMVHAHLRFSSKPFMGSVTAPERARDSIDMARIVFGADVLERDCVIQGNINVNSPLVFDEVMTGALREYARAGQGVVLSPFILGGAMGPVTQPALIAQAHAEAMAGIALTQLVRPGAPVVYGNFLTTMNLKTGAPTFGTAEANLSALAIGQLCRRLGLPLRCGGHLTASKCADGQALQESADSMTAGLLAGANYVLHAAGWLEGGLTMGYEKFVIDLEHCGMLHHFLKGLSLTEETLAREGFLEVPPGGNHLASAHTMANFANANFQADLADTQSFEQWTEEGSQTLEQRANRRWKQMLADYRPPEMDPAVAEELQEFIDRRKMAEPDKWY